jgi:hypothetical protein
MRFSNGSTYEQRACITERSYVLRLFHHFQANGHSREHPGAGFERPADTSHWTLRFPRIQKVHEDRTPKDVVSFDELQELARRCQHLAPENAKEVRNFWLARLQTSAQAVQQADCTDSQQTPEASVHEIRPVRN